MKYIHLSRFDVNTQPEAVCSFIAKALNVTPDVFTCVKLIKRDADISLLKFINFKLGVPEPLYSKAFNKSSWPLSVKITRFITKPKNEIVSQKNIPPDGELTQPILIQ